MHNHAEGAHYTAKDSRLKDLSPWMKASFALYCLVLILAADDIIFSIAAAVFAAGLCVWCGITLSSVVRVMRAPFVFIAISALLSAFHISADGRQMSGEWGGRLAGIFIWMTESSVSTALNVLARSIACVSWLALLISTTDISDMLVMANRLGVPPIVTDTASLMLRFIFSFIGAAEEIFLAQRARCGQSTFISRIRSFSLLASTVLIKAFDKTLAIDRAMKSRGYDGTIPQTKLLAPLKRGHVFCVASLAGSFAFIALLIKKSR